MKKVLWSVLLCGSGGPARGGAERNGGRRAQMAAPTDPLAAFVKSAFKSISANLIGSAEQMPETNYGMKLGNMPEVRTFGVLLGHVVNANYFYCAMAKGEANPQTTDYEKTPQTKDQLAKRCTRRLIIAERCTTR